ncbi:hypothetical protein FisN_2Lu095 [Fistulifera solaris]|uniref:Heat shock factor binding protein 1 n=1 Tax=Fistulifera solaris TaxID=1519565 RepID=A0A1Z5JWP1_FISSO|nr:hypothetical protein FisN_2Lu095 [Fistulifera solaris]|eukprot:GAX18437.1 hypothetical protein FisN_2Lu095 [Fistulifera solaris]
MSTPSPSEPANKSNDLNLMVDDLLQQMQTRFDSVGRTIETRLQDMDHRMTELETSIQELMDQAGLNGTTPKSNNNNSSAKGTAKI